MFYCKLCNFKFNCICFILFNMKRGVMFLHQDFQPTLVIAMRVSTTQNNQQKITIVRCSTFLAVSFSVRICPEHKCTFQDHAICKSGQATIIEHASEKVWTICIVFSSLLFSLFASLPSLTSPLSCINGCVIKEELISSLDSTWYLYLWNHNRREWNRTLRILGVAWL